jgi:hypothetical protein
MKSNKYILNNKSVTLLTQNSKLKETSKLNKLNVFNFGITAYKTDDGFVICKNAKECIKFCYAQNGAYNWNNTKIAYYNRFLITRKNDIFVDVIDNAIKTKKVDFLRIHDSGDFYNKTYFYNWLKIAKLNPQTKFYAYTNMINFVRNYKNDIPSNFDFIFSDSGVMTNKIDKNSERHTKIFLTNIYKGTKLEKYEQAKKQLLKEGFIDASKNDLLATKFLNPKNLKVGLIYH